MPNFELYTTELMGAGEGTGWAASSCITVQVRSSWKPGGNCNSPCGESLEDSWLGEGEGGSLSKGHVDELSPSGSTVVSLSNTSTVCRRGGGGDSRRSGGVGGRGRRGGLEGDHNCKRVGMWECPS